MYKVQVSHSVHADICDESKIRHPRPISFYVSSRAFLIVHEALKSHK